MEPATGDRAVEFERVPRVPFHRDAAQRPSASPLPNRSMSRLLSRMRDGEGILEGGVVHPDVEAAIALAHGGGRQLETGVAGRLAPTLGGPVDDVRVHDGPEAAMLARAVSARAFTVGNDIFFGAGEYRPGTSDGDRLIAHEAAHVVQQRGAPAFGPLTVSQPGDPLEREAEALAHDVPG